MPPAIDLLNDPLLRTAPVIEGFKVLPPVVLYSKLGQGGMGAVYRGHHVKLDLAVAVKCLKPELTSDDGEYVKRFQREARLAASIVHQNVVSVKEVHETHGIHYLVMELVKGETARERVQRRLLGNGKLAEPEALAIALGVALGLHEAHSRGIVHRDLKPDNVLISIDGVVKVADLGLAKGVFGGDEAGLSLATSAVMGTPQYMPPEQWESPDVKPPADIWAFGATLYYMLAGQSAIAQASVPQMARRIQEHDFPSLRALRPDVRDEVHVLIERCTKRKPEERYTDARALLKALKPLVADDDEALQDPDTGRGSLRVATVTPPPRAALLKIKQAVIASEPRIDAMLAGAAQAEATPAVTVPPRRAQTEPLSRPRRGVRGGVVALGVSVLALVGGGYGYAAGWFAGERPTGGVPGPSDDEEKARAGEAARKLAERPAPAKPPGQPITSGIGLKMLYVPPQEFAMGSPTGESGHESDEQQHKVKITQGYWLGETEVTQGQWKAVMGTEPWTGKAYTQGGADVAASYVSWTDAMDFCRKLTDLERQAGRLPEGYRYILPTEAEWELACRAGSTTTYSSGDDASELAKYAVVSDARTGEYAHVVKQQRKANRWGFFDMHGNVWEWCLDGRGDGAEETYVDGIVDPPKNVSGPLRVIRGGSWGYSAPGARSANRGGYEPGGAYGNLGFRPALSARSDVK